MVKRTIRIAVANDQLKKEWRVARAFDLSGIRSTEGAPSFALFAKGGYVQRLQLGGYATRFLNEISAKPSFSCAPARLRPKDRNDNCSSATAPAC